MNGTEAERPAIRRVAGAANAVTLEAVREAAAAIRGAVIETPTLHSRTLSEITGAQVVLKFENLQFTGSFKDRGALVKLLSLAPEQRARGVVTASRGNHAQAVAHHAKRLGIAATIVMPRNTPAVKVENTRVLGAQVVLHGANLEEAAAHARALEREHGLVYVHPYDDPDVIRGQGTIALEMLAADPAIEALLVPVGGGGLIAGIAVAAHGLRPDIEVYGVESERFPSMKRKLAGEPVVCGETTLADGIAVKQPGEITAAIVREHVRELLLVDERALEEAIGLLLEVEKTLAEGAGAAPLAALLRHRERFAGRRVGLVVSGGNIDPIVLARVIERDLVRSGRLVRLRVVLPDRPSALAALAATLGEAEANIVEVRHQRTFTQLPLESAEVDLVIETRGHAHVRDIVRRLEAGGYGVQRFAADNDGSAGAAER